MWFSLLFMVLSIVLLVIPSMRKNEGTLALACGLVVIGTWIDKGLGLITGGFVPNPLEHITEYWPTIAESLITLGVWAFGFLILSVLYKIAVSIKEEVKV
jgi:molybdopterin-containing oxidoreductase family membrane subunit